MADRALSLRIMSYATNINLSLGKNMILVTGAAGMIGSSIISHLNEVMSRKDILAVDRFEHSEQWRNLENKSISNILSPEELLTLLEGDQQFEAVLHLGAISATTEGDFRKLLEWNIRFSQRLWNWCAETETPFIYASSAATYGNGDHGYDDNIENELLRPLNAYGFSKHFFDQWALNSANNGHKPPRWYGLKYFNVYGPNESHKERMASVVYHAYNQLTQNGRMKLFKSHNPKFEDGMQLRDFVYVKDVAEISAFFIDNFATSGLYNVGTGKARSFLDLVKSVVPNIDRKCEIEFIDIPEDIREKYQYFTQANISKLRAAGYKSSFFELEDGVNDYVNKYLKKGKIL